MPHLVGDPLDRRVEQSPIVGGPIEHAIVVEALNESSAGVSDGDRGLVDLVARAKRAIRLLKGPLPDKDVDFGSPREGKSSVSDRDDAAVGGRRARSCSRSTTTGSSGG